MKLKTAKAASAYIPKVKPPQRYTKNFTAPEPGFTSG